MKHDAATMLSGLRGEVLEFIEELGGVRQAPDDRDELLRRLLVAQRQNVQAYARFLGGSSQPDPLQWPAMPTDVFRVARVASFPAEEERRVFLTSGTTASQRGRHGFRDLSLYNAASRTMARAWLFASPPHRLISLCPSERERPESSLGYMISRFGEWFSEEGRCHHVATDSPHAAAMFRNRVETSRGPLGLLGTSFHFVFLMDALRGQECPLPKGSWLMHTGGFKGRTEEVAVNVLEGRMGDVFQLPESAIHGEYGMTELSSQCYASGREGSEAHRYHVPGWVRATVVDPRTQLPARQGAVGMLRLDDLANVDSVSALQTQDRARILPDGRIELLGRSPDALPRGCSLDALAAPVTGGG